MRQWSAEPVLDLSSGSTPSSSSTMPQPDRTTNTGAVPAIGPASHDEHEATQNIFDLQRHLNPLTKPPLLRNMGATGLLAQGRETASAASLFPSLTESFLG